MHLYDLFDKPIDRDIEGVIKADDLEKLRTEIEEYVITNEVARVLEVLLEAYNSRDDHIGVWISGFFGSGKSHLLKMLSFLLENCEVDGQPTFEYFIPKLKENALLKGKLSKTVDIPSQSILFNIDQKADAISTNEFDAILAVFFKVFNEMQGYYGKLGYVAEFEKQLDKNGQYEDFKQAYRAISGKDWTFGREQVLLEKNNISQAYAQVARVPESSTENIIDQFRQDYRLSIEDFAEQVKAYVESKGDRFRLNFFVDEVGQYIADSVRLMTNLQTISESLATRCGDRAWLFVTAQEDMERVLGEMEDQGTDFSKIQDRFSTRLKLTSANVDEVIQERLLKKTEEGVRICSSLYAAQKNNLGTLFGFSDGSPTYRKYRDEKHFVLTYPFIPYQFSLFQSSIEALSQFNAFEGRHRSVGERSMLGVFQDVVVHIGQKEPGELATFDLMFNGIKATLKSQVVSSVRNAEKQLDSEFAKRLLKALFLVKYVKGFKATPRNLRVLMQERFDQDLPELQEKVEEALAVLEQQTYIQRNGDVYEYLTNEEKDVETRIKTTEVDNSAVVQMLDDIFYAQILKDRKIRYSDTNQDYPFSRMIDGRLQGREHELSINVITPFNEHASDPRTIQAHAMGKPELTVLLPADDRFLKDVLLHKKTEKYIRLTQSSSERETVRRILGEKSLQNQERYRAIQEAGKALVAKATFYLAGDEVEIRGEDPRNKLHSAFNHLLKKVYPNLRMLKGGPYQEQDIERYLNLAGESSMFQGDTATFSEAEQEMLIFLQGNTRSGIRTTLKSVEEKFSTRPYGWYLAAIQCNLAKLLGRGKIEARADGRLLEGGDIVGALTNTRQFGNVILDPAPDVPPAQLKEAKTFFNDFFGRPPTASEARALGREIKEALRNMLDELEVLKSRAGRYPFLSSLAAPIETLEALLSVSYEHFFSDGFADDKDALLAVKEETLDPIRRFMSGSAREIYASAVEFVDRQTANFSYVTNGHDKHLRALLDNPGVYQGDHVREIKESVDQLQRYIADLLEKERGRAEIKLEELRTRLQYMEDYATLPKEDRQTFTEQFDQAKSTLLRQTLIPVIRDEVDRFESDTYRRMLEQITALGHGESEGDATPIKIVSQADLTVPFNQPILASEEDVERYLKVLREALLEALRKNNHIQI